MCNMAPRLTINRLHSGGLITNYYCTSRCRHCLYRCSPWWPKEYISEDSARENCIAIRSLGCRSVHIGGGEPLLKPDQLLRILETAFETGVGIDYVETNSSWYHDHDSATEILENLLTRGVLTLLVSISPLHNEFIPFYKVKAVIEACREVGMGIFPWIRDFYPDLDNFDDRSPHSLEEYQATFGRDYLQRLPERYWISAGGRALETFGCFGPQLSPADLAVKSGPCRELDDTSHFHLDLFGNYIPGLCAGLAIDRDDLGRTLPRDDYPILTALYSKGVGGLLEMAEREFDFHPQRTSYGSKCELCYEIRKFMVTEKEFESHELQPVEHYQER